MMSNLEVIILFDYFCLWILSGEENSLEFKKKFFDVLIMVCMGGLMFVIYKCVWEVDVYMEIVYFVKIVLLVVEENVRVGVWY